MNNSKMVTQNKHELHPCVNIIEVRGSEEWIRSLVDLIDFRKEKEFLKKWSLYKRKINYIN